LLMHAAVTHPLSPRGLEVPEGVMALDNRPYRISETSTLSVQDENGLISLNVSDDNTLRRLFTVIGLPAERHDRLLDTLHDYIDIDNFKRLNGAEQSEYQAAGLPPPANNFLISRDTLRSIPGWRELMLELETSGTPGALDRFLDLFSVSRYTLLNLNTAPRLILRATPGIDPQRVDALIARRREAAFNNLAEVAPFTNGPLDIDTAYIVNANAWRLTHHRSDLPFLLECRLVITPAAIDRPAEVSECRHRPKLLAPSDPASDELFSQSRFFDSTHPGVKTLSKTDPELRTPDIIDEAAPLAWLTAPLGSRKQ
ncbi:MAG: general secretion pathway protein GspK, partial [Betaproteobacteria bacterium]|nr:general secretion pathway protein GspK [Betaproteobacteria bacterium]